MTGQLTGIQMQTPNLFCSALLLFLLQTTPLHDQHRTPPSPLPPLWLALHPHLTFLMGGDEEARGSRRSPHASSINHGPGQGPHVNLPSPSGWAKPRPWLPWTIVQNSACSSIKNPINLAGPSKSQAACPTSLSFTPVPLGREPRASPLASYRAKLCSTCLARHVMATKHPYP